MTIQLLLADDHTVLRTGLKMLLNAQPDIKVVGEAADGEEAIRLTEHLRPDPVLLDLTMPGLAGLEALKRIKAAHPDVQVLVLTMHDDEGYLRSALEAGASGYVLKQAADTQLLSAVRAVYQGGTFLHASHTRVLLDIHASNQPAPSISIHDKDEPYQRLSEREAQVFRLVALGFRNSEIAEKLHLSVKTVETYKARLMQKLELRSRAALVRYALQLGLLDIDDQN